MTDGLCSWLLSLLLLAAMMWTVGMAKPDTAARGPSQQMWDAGLLECYSSIQSTVPWK